MTEEADLIPIYVKEDLCIYYKPPETIEHDGVLSIKSGVFIIKINDNEEEIEVEDALYIIHVLTYMIRTDFEQAHSTQLLALNALKKPKLIGNDNKMYV